MMYWLGIFCFDNWLHLSNDGGKLRDQCEYVGASHRSRRVRDAHKTFVGFIVDYA